ncbi:hypothetical protein BGZ46_005888 [Entomortierella lignicola]|nr:hypothetical protein BGZ46_005888 [Entomortierella lignicola]
MGQTPKIMIVGAGLGGLMLAILLEKMGIEYDILERSTTLKPLGAAMGFGPNIMPVFEQLGLLDDLLKVALPTATMDVFDGNLKMIGSMDIAGRRGSVGYDAIAFSRPDLHGLLLSKVPTERIHYGKRVETVEQSDEKAKAIIRCTDGTTYECDILVGADGAYSTVRQQMFQSLEKEGKLLKKDTESLDMGFTCLVGTTLPLDPEKYPELKDKYTHFSVVIANDQPHSVTILNVPGNRICYGVVIQLSAEEREAASKNKEWSSQSVDSTIDKIMHHKVPFGGTLGDFINLTPRDLISNVYLEEKMFETWTHGRIALLGDACHKMLPSAGQGAINAIQDAVILSNCIYDLVSTSRADVEVALAGYREQRFAFAKEAVGNSATAGKLLYGQTWLEKVLRKMVFGWMPKWLEDLNLNKAAAYQPQLTFLPRIPNRGTVQPVPQKWSKRYQDEQRLEANASSV